MDDRRLAVHVRRWVGGLRVGCGLALGSGWGVDGRADCRRWGCGSHPPLRAPRRRRTCWMRTCGALWRGGAHGRDAAARPGADRADLVSRRRQLVETRVQEKNRRDKGLTRAVAQSTRRHLACWTGRSPGWRRRSSRRWPTARSWRAGRSSARGRSSAPTGWRWAPPRWPFLPYRRGPAAARQAGQSGPSRRDAMLLLHLNAVARRGTPWIEEPARPCHFERSEKSKGLIHGTGPLRVPSPQESRRSDRPRLRRRPNTPV